MPNATQDAVRAVLREDGPLPPDEVAARLVARQMLATKNPRQTDCSAVANDPLCQNAGDGRYVYLPSCTARR